MSKGLKLVRCRRCGRPVLSVALYRKGPSSVSKRRVLLEPLAWSRCYSLESAVGGVAVAYRVREVATLHSKVCRGSR